MWIRVGKKEILMDVKMICINKGILKKSKTTISGAIDNTGIPVSLGEYETYEEAKRIFEDIQENIVQDSKLYIMP